MSATLKFRLAAIIDSLIEQFLDLFDKYIIDPIGGFINITRGMRSQIPITRLDNAHKNIIEAYWTDHTVFAPQFRSSYLSRKYITKRFNNHPLFQQLSGLYGIHDGETILDYGCGPGNDVLGFSLNTNAKKIIGMDISYTSLKLTAKRLELHEIDPNRITLIQNRDSDSYIPLPDNSMDFINCQGVLMHTSQPEVLISEFYRILKPGSCATIMVYVKDSIWYHLYTAYETMIIRGKFASYDVATAFSLNTDGENCPMARCYHLDTFRLLCESEGFRCTFVGGYFTHTELNSISKYYKKSLLDPRLNENHKQFLQSLKFDKKGFPTYNDHYAGLSGVFHLFK